MRYLFLAMFTLSILTMCATPPPLSTPTMHPLPPRLTSTPTSPPTQTQEWGLAFTVLDPNSVSTGGDNKLTTLYLIHPDGNNPTRIFEETEFITDLIASPDGHHLLFSAIREDTDGDGYLGPFDLPHLYVVDVRNGEIVTLTSGSTTTEWAPAWSPDGERIAFVMAEVNASNRTRVTKRQVHLYVMDRDSIQKKRLTEQEGYIPTMDWSPTGEHLIFQQNSAVWIAGTNDAKPRKLIDAPMQYTWRPYLAEPVWSPDGKRIAFVAPGVGAENNADIFLVNADGSSLSNLTAHPAQDFWPVWSPNGEYLMFVTTRHGYEAIYTVSVDGNELQRVFSNPEVGAYSPLWSPDGSEIAFVVGTSTLWKQHLYITSWPEVSPYQLSEEYVGEQLAWILMPFSQGE